MKRKVRKGQRTQTVRVEVVAPQNGHTEAIVPAPQVMQDNMEVALEIARKQMYYRQQLLKLIASQVKQSDVYVYVRAQTCKKCGGAVKPSFQGDGFYCKNCKQIPRSGAVEDLEPYLSGTGCRFVLSSAGVKFDEPEMKSPTYDGTEGPYIDFEVWVTVTPKVGNPIRTFGNNPTNDDFFAKRWRYICPQCSSVTTYRDGRASCSQHGEVRARREAYYLTLQEVDVSGVKQKAMTNAWNHAVRDLGLMPTAEHFRDAGVDISKCKRISFGRGSGEEEFSEFPAAASKLPPEKAATGVGASSRESKTPAGGAKSKETPTARGNPTQQAGHAANDEGKPSTTRDEEKAARNSSNAVPQARIPVVVTQVKWTKSGAGLEVTLHGGKKLYCFDNRKMGEDGEKLFDLLVNAQGKECIFLTAKNATKGTAEKPSREFTNITAAIQIGDREWTEEGIPVLRRDPPTQAVREPGDDSAEDLGWDQTEQMFPGARK